MAIDWSTEELLKFDRDHILHPTCPVGQNLGIVFKKGRGVILQDTEDKEYIDCASQLTCVNLGYGRIEIVDAIVEQMNKLEYTTLFFGFSHVAAIECGQRLAELTPQGLDHFLFTSGGSEGTETAFKIARLSTKKHKIISLYDSYHGVTLGSLSATGEGKGTEWHGLEPLAPGFIRIPSYYCYRCPFGKVYPSCDIQCAEFLAETIEREGSESVAAFIAEPVIGAGGTIFPPPEYWPRIREICTKYHVLLIADEVMTGFGRTGKFLALEHWGVEPDIMVMAKGITSAYFPFGAVAINDNVYNRLKGLTFSAFTHSGHPVGSAVAVKAIEIYAREKVIENSARVGKHALDRLHAEFQTLPCVGAISGLGLFIGIEVVEDKDSKTSFDPELKVPMQIQKKARESGLLIRSRNIANSAGDRISLSPPLTITTEEIDRALEILYPILADTKT
jgi:putrescine aminotransferase